jgi:hypothetical protein
MCFDIHHLHPDKKIAEKDIPCYKIVCTYGGEELEDYPEGEYSSEWENFEYKDGITYTDPEALKIRTVYFPAGDFNMAVIDRGFHSFSNIDEAGSRNILLHTIIRCIIPQGSEYYFNPDDGEYVSNSIKIIGLP